MRTQYHAKHDERAVALSRVTSFVFREPSHALALSDFKKSRHDCHDVRLNALSALLEHVCKTFLSSLSIRSVN